jgi:hypothetical protein
MTSQMEADQLLEEHRAVMAAHYRDCINRPTEDQYEALLDQLRTECMSCPEITYSPSFSPSQGASQ